MAFHPRERRRWLDRRQFLAARPRSARPRPASAPALLAAAAATTTSGGDDGEAA